jgi:Domain of unknown function (DUF6602)
LDVIDEYWTGVLQRLQVEVDVFSRLISHRGEQGRENEQALSRVLAGLLPGRFAVGTGLLFDVNGHQSKQMDLIVYDQIDSPTLLAQTTQLLYPVEEVRCCIEVKTTLNKAQVEDAGAKKKSILDLTRVQAAAAPLFALFAFDTETSPSAVARNLESLPPECRPDLSCVLDPGMIAGNAEILGLEATSPDEFCHGLTLLHDLSSGARVRGEFVMGQPGQYASWEARGGIVYPVVERGKERILSDPSRALLLFCESLLRWFAKRDGRDVPVLSSYLLAPYRDLDQI